MITIRQFIGALLGEVTKARAISDEASVQIAKKYLDHPFLKGFPVPRMHVREIDLELNFAVADNMHSVSIFEEEEVRQNIRNQLRQFVESLPGKPELSPFFAQNPELGARWTSGLGDLDARFEKALARKESSRISIANAVSIIIENYFFEIAGGQPHHGLLNLVMRAVKREDHSQARQSVNTYIADQAREIIDSVDTAQTEAEALSDLLDVNVLVGAAELEKVRPESLHKMKLKFNASDRKWVITDSGGEKTAILGRT